MGDACHFKHPGTVQGIGDAVEQANYGAKALTDGSGDLDGYERWRDERAREHYEWSFSWGRFPRPGSERVFRAGRPSQMPARTYAIPSVDTSCPLRW